MKNSYISKTLISISMLSMIIVGCGKDNNKEFFKVKLDNLTPSASVSSNELEYKFHGKYENCSYKTTSDNWILHKDQKLSDLEVLKDDKNCKLNLTKVEIGTGDNIQTYEYNDTKANTLKETAEDYIKFFDKENSNNINVKISMTPIDFSAAPAITIKIATLTEIMNEIKTENLVYIDSISSLSINSANPPDYTIDASKLTTKFDKLGKAHFGGDLDFTLKNGGKKASKYFILANDLNLTDYNKINEFFTNQSNAAHMKTSGANSDKITIAKEEIENLTSGIKTAKAQSLNLKVVLVNTENGINSYAVHKINLKRS
ncbi:hypothetical protein [Fluviispira vulneris]|uniref:hypothetical protein n=1 Tax=Fluviispira vulneris TaxID=2763012 RepID=UPI001646E27C|nr:hypothetical protein [Fluviispira vulneris]